MMQADDDITVPDHAPTGIYDESGQPRFFSDPAVDRLMSVVLQLTSEVWVLAERLQTLEDLAQAKGHLTLDEIQSHRPDATAMKQREADRDRFVRSVLGPLREIRP